MQELNYLTMLTAVRNCVKKDGLRIGIFTKTQADRVRIFSELRESMDEEEREAVFRIVGGSVNNTIEFKNGSFIKILAASENTRGHSFHEVLYEEGIDEYVLNHVVVPSERLYPRTEEDCCMTSPTRNNVFIVGKEKKDPKNVPVVDASRINEAIRRLGNYTRLSASHATTKAPDGWNYDEATGTFYPDAAREYQQILERGTTINF